MGLFMGIDIGTSSIAVVLWCPDKKRIINSVCIEHRAKIKELSVDRSEQDVDVLFRTVREAIEKLSGKNSTTIRAIGVTGQMHGVVLSNAALEPVSSLVTHLDRRCNSGELLNRLNKICCSQQIASGYGTATLAWLIEHEKIPRATFASTIQDLLVARLVNLKRPMTDPTNAASWGFYNRMARNWYVDKLITARIPVNLMPTVVPSRTLAGQVCVKASKEYGLRAGTPVMVAIGDNQASIVASVGDRGPDRVLILTIGTAAQLSAVMPCDFVPEHLEQYPAFEYRPYLDDRLIGVAAAYSGGAILDWFISTVTSWCRDLGMLDINRNWLFETLNKLGGDAQDSELVVTPTIFGERYKRTTGGKINGIGPCNFSLGEIHRALSKGIIANLHSLVPPSVLDNREVIVGNGNGLRLNTLMQQCVRDVMRLPLELNDHQEEAALGAAILAFDMFQKDEHCYQLNLT